MENWGIKRKNKKKILVKEKFEVGNENVEKVGLVREGNCYPHLKKRISDKKFIRFTISSANSATSAVKNRSFDSLISGITKGNWMTEIE